MRFGTERRLLLIEGLQNYTYRPLPGARTPQRQEALVEQFIDSIRRIDFVHRLREAELHPSRCDPRELSMFDPLRAAAIKHREGNLDEAYWLVFLATHCGKHILDQWSLARTLYGRNGAGNLWNWASISANPEDFHTWITRSYRELRTDGISRRFGNHRKYETLRPDSHRGTSKIFSSYVSWVGANRGHALLIDEAEQECGGDPKKMFDHLYHAMAAVTSFGRTGRFDFLTMVGKLGLANIEPGIPYLVGATGPLAGARLLFGGNHSANLSPQKLNQWVVELGDYLGLGMQIMEDSLCNWQKSPDTYLAFRG
ncbi:alpha-glutamyl/putrescinyl thymine pyrophosphorylase clade 3 protein [Azospirillum argentinense]|uniref:alpha-glutamyl/putrescinyl thymine pyrophosphorylase clade 3 protein n=1 Tax=Azospirillum argentinense TaxID=2970906 RepID=UPI001185966C|nr:hypothetical protein [Azospirillum argentinense]